MSDTLVQDFDDVMHVPTTHEAMAPVTVLEAPGAAMPLSAKKEAFSVQREEEELAAPSADPFLRVSDRSHETEAFTAKRDELFPGTWNHEEASVAITHLLRRHGFSADNSIALVAQCRDEIAKPFLEAIDANWLGSFNISSLAGTVLCGKVGFGAAIHHAPLDADGVERYVVFCGPHIAIDEDGVVGNVRRRGRKPMSNACGALIAFERELRSGKVDVGEKPLDSEYCALKRRLLAGLTFGEA